MKLLVLCLCLAATLSAQQTSAPNPATGTADIADANAAKGRELILGMIKALGGDAFLHYTDVEQEGRGSGFHNGQVTGTTNFWRFVKPLDKDRTELTKDRDVIVIHNGNSGTETTFHGTRPEEEEVHRAYMLRDQYSLDRVLRTWLNAPGTTFFYEGQGFTDNHQVEKVTIANAQNQQETFYIDQETHLPVRKSFTVRDPQYKDKDTYSTIYAEYRLDQGIQTPHIVTSMKNDEMVSQTFLTKVAYNKGLQDSMFEPPTSLSAKKKK